MSKDIAALRYLQNLLFSVTACLIKLHFSGSNAVKADNRISLIKNNLLSFVLVGCFALLKKCEIFFRKVRTYTADGHSKASCVFHFLVPWDLSGSESFL